MLANCQSKVNMEKNGPTMMNRNSHENVISPNYLSALVCDYSHKTNYLLLKKNIKAVQIFCNKKNNFANKYSLLGKRHTIYMLLCILTINTSIIWLAAK